MADELTRAEATALAEFPRSYEALATLAEREGYFLRLRKIARLENAGLDAAGIAQRLNRAGQSWSMEAVLFYMGLGSEGTQKEREERRQKYLSVREEVRHPEMIDFDAQIRESQASALRTIRDIMESAPDVRDRKSAAESLLKMSGVAADKTEMKIVEIRMPKDATSAIKQMLNWKPPAGLLDAMTGDAERKPGYVYCATCDMSAPCPNCKKR